MTTELYSDGTENVSTVPIKANPGDGDMRVVYSVAVSALAGDLLEAMGQYEVTNDVGYNVGIGCGLVLASTSTGVNGDALAKNTMTVCTPDIHHHVGRPHGMKKFASNWSGYANLVVWAASSAAVTGDTITVEAGYGQVDVALIR